MNSDDFLAIKNELPALRKHIVDSQHGRIPQSIEYLENAIARATTREDKAALYTLVLSECSRSKNDELAVHFLREQVRDLPDDPLSLTSLATQLARSRRTQSEALILAARGVTLAKERDRQVKYSLTCQARVALAVGDYDVFNKTLRDLIEDADKNREEDHGFEYDFLDHADPAQVDQELASRYRALAA